MPLSDTAKKALDNSAKINATQQAQQNAEKQQAQQTLKDEQEKAENERLRQEKEYNDYIQEEANLKNQIELLNQEKAQQEATQKEYDDQIKIQNDLIYQQEQIVLNAENEKLLQQQQKQKAQADYQKQLTELDQPYADKIDNLINEQLTAKAELHTAFWEEGGGHDKGQSRSNLTNQMNKVERRYDSLIEQAQGERRQVNLSFEARNSPDIPKPFITKAIRTFGSGVGFENTSILQIAKKEYDSFIAESQRERKSSITTAQSNAVLEREKLTTIQREFEQTKITNDKIAQTNQKIIILNNDLEQATKRKTEIKDSSFFKGHESSVIPSDIIGTTSQKSIQAQQTLKEIEEKQKKLEFDTRVANTSKEAIKIRQKARLNDPYVGTANTILKKGIITSQAGVLVDLKLDKKFDKKSITSQQAHPEIELETYNPQTTAKDDLEKIPNITPTKPTIPQYEFIDSEGQKITLTAGDLFAFTSSLIDKKAQMPSEVDKFFNQYLQENKQAVIQTEQSGQSGETQNLIPKEGFTRGLLDTGTEIKATVLNINKPENLQEPTPETIEGVLFADLIGQGSKLLGLSDYDEQKTKDYIDDKLKTPRGIETLAGSVFGAVAINYALALIPGAIQSKVVVKVAQKIETKELIKVVEKTTQKLRETPESIKFTKSLDKYPEMPESMKKELLKKKDLENVVGYEILDSKTALIKRGTENGQELTPYIVVRTGKNPRSTLYQTYTAENPGAFKNIIVSGNQAGELSKGVKITDDIKSYPANRDNVLKVDNESKLAKVGIKQNVGQEGFVQNPKGVIEKIETQKVTTGDLIVETERKNPVKSMNQDVKGLNQIENPRIKTTKTKPFEETKNISDKIELPPTSKPDPILKGSNITNENKRLEKFIKSEQTGKEKIKVEGEIYTTKLKTYSANAGIVITSARSKVSQNQNIDVSTTQTQIQKQPQTQQQEIILDTPQKTDTITPQIETLKTRLEIQQKQKPILDPKYSLIVTGKYKQELGTVPVYTLEQKQKQSHRTDTPIPSPNRIKNPTPPGLTISLNLDDKKPVTSKAKGGRVKLGFYRYNVNTDSVGRYIPQVRHISTGRTRKVIDRIDRLERKINTPKYHKKQIKRERKQYEKSVTVFRKKKESFDSRGDIPNITAPKGKKARKFLKKFGVDLGF